MEMLNSEFNDISQDLSCPDLFPKKLQAEMIELNDYIFSNITIGVYMCGLTDSQVCPTRTSAAAQLEQAML